MIPSDVCVMREHENRLWLLRTGDTYQVRIHCLDAPDVFHKFDNEAKAYKCYMETIEDLNDVIEYCYIDGDQLVVMWVEDRLSCSDTLPRWVLRHDGLVRDMRYPRHALVNKGSSTWFIHFDPKAYKGKWRSDRTCVEVSSLKDAIRFVELYEAGEVDTIEITN